MVLGSFSRTLVTGAGTGTFTVSIAAFSSFLSLLSEHENVVKIMRVKKI
jgi:hypothetical protein